MIHAAAMLNVGILLHNRLVNWVTARNFTPRILEDETWQWRHVRGLSVIEMSREALHTKMMVFVIGNDVSGLETQGTCIRPVMPFGRFSTLRWP